MLHEELADYERRLQSLLAALDGEVDAESLLRLSESTREQFEIVSLTWERSSANERDALQSELTRLRSFAALIDDAARRKSAKVGLRLNEIRRARQVLTQLDARATGEACDVAG